MTGPDRPMLRRMQALSQDIAARRLDLLNLTMGELAWTWAKDAAALQPYWAFHSWEHAGALQAWGWVTLPHRLPRGDGFVRISEFAELNWQVHPDYPALLDDVLHWYEAATPQLDRTFVRQAADTQAENIALQRGYQFDTEAGGATGDWIQLNSRSLASVERPQLPDGYRFVTAQDVSASAAVAVHRDAWHPSGFTQAAFAQVQDTWPYRPDFHVFLQAPDATLAASAIIWLDEANGMAEFEPVGTHRAHRRKGLGTALLTFGMARAFAAGAHTMLVASLGAEDKAQARAMYEKLGFTPISRDVPYIKRASVA